MFFRHYWFYILGLLPVHGRLSRYLRVALGNHDHKRDLITWHRAELEKLDPMFQLQQNSLRLTSAREKALAEGISPMDLRYPSFFDSSIIDWEEEARVHSDVLKEFKKTSDERMQRLAEALRDYPQERVDAVTQACLDALKRKSR